MDSLPLSCYRSWRVIFIPFLVEPGIACTCGSQRGMVCCVVRVGDDAPWMGPSVCSHLLCSFHVKNVKKSNKKKANFQTLYTVTSRPRRAPPTSRPCILYITPGLGVCRRRRRAPPTSRPYISDLVYYISRRACGHDDADDKGRTRWPVLYMMSTS